MDGRVTTWIVMRGKSSPMVLWGCSIINRYDHLSRYLTGGWFGTSILFSQKYWVSIIIPIDVHIFQRGGPTTNQIAKLTCIIFPKWWLMRSFEKGLLVYHLSRYLSILVFISYTIIFLPAMKSVKRRLEKFTSLSRRLSPGKSPVVPPRGPRGATRYPRIPKVRPVGIDCYPSRRTK